MTTAIIGAGSIGPYWAAAVSSDPGTALRIHAREELGVDPDELPSPLLAGAASLLAFSFGALVPLLPYLVGEPVLAVTLTAQGPGRGPRTPGHGQAVSRATVIRARERRPAVMVPAGW